MFIISKKRINLIIFAIILAVGCFIYSKQDLTEQESGIEVTAVPCSGKIVVLDAGHRHTR